MQRVSFRKNCFYSVINHEEKGSMARELEDLKITIHLLELLKAKERIRNGSLKPRTETLS